MRKQLAILGLSAGLVGGGAAGFALTSTTGLAGAQTETTTTVVDGATTDQERPDPSTHLADALAPLVSDGTITQAQADKVIEALKAAGPPDGGRGGHGGPGGRHGGPGLDAAATALGVTADELRTELESGKTLADVAGEKGVAVDTLVQALVDAETAKINEAVTAGRMTQEQADERLADLETRVTARVNGEMPEGGPGRGPGGEPPADAPAAPSDSTTTTEG